MHLSYTHHWFNPRLHGLQSSNKASVKFLLLLTSECFSIWRVYSWPRCLRLVYGVQQSNHFSKECSGLQTIHWSHNQLKFQFYSHYLKSDFLRIRAFSHSKPLFRYVSLKYSCVLSCLQKPQVIHWAFIYRSTKNNTRAITLHSACFIKTVSSLNPHNW